jgi:glycosyltransferase involved in cell wall biosynthesis
MTTLPPTSTAKQRRILISGGLAAGGPETHVPLLCAVLRQAGADVTVVSASTNWNAAALQKLRATGVRIVVSPFGFGPLQILGKLWIFLVGPFLLRRDYDVLCCIGHGRLHLWARRFVREGGTTIYHEIVECPRPGSVTQQVAARMDAIVANSAGIARSMTQLFPDTPIRAIPFLTSDASVPPPTPRAPRPGDVLRIAYLGRIVPHKRPVELVEALPAWNASAPVAPARLDLYGHDFEGEGTRLRNRIAALGLAACAAFHGAYSPADLDRIFAQTDLVVLPSLWEGLPLVLVEAMQRGIPIVATSAGGVVELGDNNPDVIITPGTAWAAFAAGVTAMAERIRANQIDPVRLHAWTEARYGYAPVAAAWREALLSPETYFATNPATEVLA